MDGQREESEEDSDFIDSDQDFESEHDDIEYERNVTSGVEIGLDSREDEVQDEQAEGNVNELDDLELPSTEELLSQCSSDEDGRDHFPEFSIDQDMKNSQFEEWFEGNLQPVGGHRDIALDERGKMVADRGQADHYPTNEQTFHFIPTPMVSRGARSSGMQTGTAAMMCTQSVPVDVPTDAVNFDDDVDDENNLGDAESATVRVSRERKRRRAKGSTSAGT